MKRAFTAGISLLAVAASYAQAADQKAVTDLGAVNAEAAAHAFPKRGFSPFAGRYLMPARRAWKSVNVLTELTSSHEPTPGAHASRS